MHLESFGYLATAAAAGGTAATAFPGDSLAIKNAVDGSKIKLVSVFSINQTLGAQQIVAPSFNDTTRGIRWVGPAAALAVPFLPPMVQPLVPQELISATVTGTAVAGNIESGICSVWYENSPGLSGRYLTADEVMQRGIRSVTVQASVTATAVGGWTGGELLTADSDLLRANTNYALIGGNTGLAVTAIGVRAPDWSNLRVAIPSTPGFPEVGNSWFARLSQAAGMPLIPIFNSANKNNIFVDIADDENGGATTLQLNLVELPDGV